MEVFSVTMKLGESVSQRIMGGVEFLWDRLFASARANGNSPYSVRRGQDLNLQSSGHEPDELTNSSTPLKKLYLSFY